MRKLLLEAKSYGGSSVLALDGDKWQSSTIEYMPIRFFKKFGFDEVERYGTNVLLYKRLGNRNIPSLILPKYKPIPKLNKKCVNFFLMINVLGLNL